MADAYGMITFSKSQDCVVDMESLKNVLNNYQWDNSGATWSYSEDYPLLYIDNYGFDRPQYPVAVPKEVVAYNICVNPSEWIKKSPDELTDEEWLNADDPIYCSVSLKTFSEEVSPLLNSGWIEIACVANEKLRYVYFELLRIYADGRVLSKFHESGPCCAPLEKLDSYSPLLK